MTGRSASPTSFAYPLIKNYNKKNLILTTEKEKKTREKIVQKNFHYRNIVKLYSCINRFPYCPY